MRASPRREREKKLFSQIHFFFSKTRKARRDESFGITFRAFGDGRLCRSFSVGPSLGGNSLWVSLSLYLETFSLFFRPSQNPTKYTYSCSARRDESIDITLRVFGDGRLFSKKFLSIETQSHLPPGEEPAVSGLSRRPSPNTLKVIPNDSSRRA